jgi:hypothetical protein
MSFGAVAGAVAAAAVSAGASALSASSGKKASKKAMQAEVAAFNASIEKQLEMYNLSAAEMKNALALVERYQQDAYKQIAANQAPYQGMGSLGLAGMNYTMGKSMLVPPQKPTGRADPGAQARVRNATAAREAFNRDFADAQESNRYGSWEELSGAFKERLDAVEKEQQAANAAAAVRNPTSEELAQYEVDLKKYFADVEKEKADPNFGKATKSYQEATGDKYPEFKPYDKSIPEFKAFDKPIPEWTPTTIEDMKADPGYQFRLEQGLGAVENSAAARGALLGGNTIKALNEYGQGFASNEFGNVNERRQQDYGNKVSEWGIGYNKNTEDWQNLLADWGANYQKYMGDYNTQTGSYMNKYNMYNMDRDNPFNKYLTLMGFGQEANQNVNAATTNLANMLSGNISAYANNMATLNTNLANSYSQNRQGIGGSESNNAINQGNINSAMIKSIGSDLATLLSSSTGSGGVNKTNTGADKQLNNAVSGNLSSWATRKNIFG